MDHFDFGQDPFCTPEGRAQNRVPSDLTQAAIQQGTVINEVITNGLVFEVVNAIRALGENPTRGKEDQLATGLLNMLMYQRIGQVNRWLGWSQNLPTGEALLLGGELDPADFVDGLAELKKRCPDWVQGNGKIRLPNYDRYYGVMDMRRALGTVQEDAQQRIEGGLGYALEHQDWFTPTGPFSGSPSGGAHLSASGGGNRGFVSFDSARVVRTADENRPRNINELHSVTVGMPKTRTNPTLFYMTEGGAYTGQSITLYQGESGAFMGLNPATMTQTPDPVPFEEPVKTTKKGKQ